MSEFLAKNLPVIRSALDEHNRECPVPAQAILLNPTDQEKLALAVPELWGLPVCPDDRVRVGYFRIKCEGSAWHMEDELLAYIEAPVEQVPIPAAPREHPLAAVHFVLRSGD
jgi:hypothetical protein